jgi:DnaJ family protein C protein 9
LDGLDVGGDVFDLAFEFFRGIFPKITTEDIENFAERYRGSDEETQDVLEYLKR